MNIIKRLKIYDQFYTDGHPTVSDRDYDLWKAKARQEFPNHPYFQIVGAPVKGVKTKLPVVLGSLDKVKSTDGTYDSWCRDNKGAKVYWAKMDGISLYKKYVDGKLVQAITRGNGEYGQDITSKAMLFCQLELGDNFTGEIRAEAMLVGATIHTELGYTTRRNGAAGLINQDSLENVGKLITKSYEIISDSKGVFSTEWERIGRMEEIGLNLAPCLMFEKDLTDEEMSNLLKDYKAMGYDVDGVVVALNNSEREDVKYPTFKVAWKGVDISVPCEVVDVEWNVGRTGRLTPTVVIIPTIIGGVTVERATGFNAKFIQDNGIQKGIIVNICRANEVIPYIDSVETV